MTEEKLAGAVYWAMGLAFLLLLAIGPALAADDSRGSLVEQVRAANDRFKDASVAASEGYSPIPCASGVDGGGEVVVAQAQRTAAFGIGR